MLTKRSSFAMTSCSRGRLVVLFSLVLVAFFAVEALSLPRTPWKGRDIFEKKGCTRCHSVFGKGGKGGPDLGEHRFYGTYLELAAVMWNHLPGMLERMEKSGYEFPHLDAVEMEQLIGYLGFMRYIGEEGNERKGRRLLKSKGCTSCHRFGGEGGDIGPDMSSRKEYLYPLELVRSMWNHGPNMLHIFEERGIERPYLDGDEIIDLAAGIRSYMSPTRVPPQAEYLGDPQRGKKLTEEKGCVRCHAVRGAGEGPAPDFARLDLDCSVTEIAGRMWNHGPKMWETMEDKGIPFPTFEEEEMADVLSYLYALRLEDEPGDRGEGKRIVFEKGCSSCHSVGGRAGEVGKDFAMLDRMESPIEMVASMWNHAPAMKKKQAENKVEWPRLNGRDMAHLYAFLHYVAGKVEESGR